MLAVLVSLLTRRSQRCTEADGVARGWFETCWCGSTNGGYYGVAIVVVAAGTIDRI